MMTDQDKVAYWVDLAEYDLETAKALAGYQALSVRWFHVSAGSRKNVKSVVCVAYPTSSAEDTPFNQIGRIDRHSARDTYFRKANTF